MDPGAFGLCWGGSPDDCDLDLFLEEEVYYCTDDIPYVGYFCPGDWVHGDVEFVEEIELQSSMSEPDLMQSDWSEGKLWPVW